MTDKSLQGKIAEIAADSSKVIILEHALQRMRKRHVVITQVIQVLRKGSIIEHAHQDVRGRWKCTLGLVVSGDCIKVAASLGENEFKEKVIVITVMN